jgi:hypothetical protein
MIRTLMKTPSPGHTSTRVALSRILVGMLLTCGLVLTMDIPAQASAPTCRGNGCTSKDPKTTGCARDALTMWEFSDGLIRVELRYSPKCDAAWTRWSTGKQLEHSHEIYIRRYRRDSRGFHKTKEYRTFTKTARHRSGWTKMIGMPRSGAYFKACDLERDCTRYWPVP